MTTVAAIVIVAAAFIGGYFLGRGGGAAILRRYRLWALPLAAIVVGGALYAWLGSARTVSMPAPPPGIAAGLGAAPAPQPQQAPPGGSGGDLGVMARRLAEKMAKDPNNGEGWLLLARTYGELHQAEAAEQAYAKAAQLQKPDATVLADWADARVMARGRQWDSVARELVARALAAEPRHPKALALAGSAAFAAADYKGAIGYWRRMQAVAAADSMDAKLAAANIAEATALMSGQRPAPAAAAAKAPGIAGSVTLDAALRDKVAPTDTVFVVAKALEGGGPPLAVKRFPASALPLQFELDDSSAMLPQRTLSRAGTALLSARLSRSGNAIPQPEDIVSAGVRATVGSTGIRLELGTPPQRN